MTSTTTYRSGKDFRAFVQNSVAAQERERPVKPTPLKNLRARAETALIPGRAERLAGPLRAGVAGELAFCAEAAARMGARWRHWRENRQAGLVALKERLATKQKLAFRLSRALEKPAVFRDSIELPTTLEKDWAADLAKEHAAREHLAAEVASLGGESIRQAKAAVPFDRFGNGFLTAARQVGVIMRPVARMVYAWRDAALKLAVICVALLCAAGLLAQWPAAAPEVTAPEPAAPPRAAWLDVARPYQVYELSAPQLAHEKLVYAARRHSPGGGREDSLTFGDFGGKKIFLRLSVYRHGAEKAADAPFFVEMARRAAPLGLSIVHATLEQNQPTRFGGLETAALSLSEGHFTRENCRGFRLSQEEAEAQPGLTIAGLACAAADEMMSATELACMVNRLDLLAAGEDRSLRDFFGAAQARGVRACGSGAHR